MVKKSSRDDRKRCEARKVEVMDKNEGQTQRDVMRIRLGNYSTRFDKKSGHCSESHHSLYKTSIFLLLLDTLFFRNTFEKIPMSHATA